MKQVGLIVVLAAFFMSACVYSQHLPQKEMIAREISERIQVDQKLSEPALDDPFAKKSHDDHKKKAHKKDAEGFPTREQAKKEWGIYEPFDDKDEKHRKTPRQRDDEDTQNFNELLRWGMIIGSGFLVIVMVKTCTKKRGRRQMRRLRQLHPECPFNAQFSAQPIQPVYNYTQRPLVQQPVMVPSQPNIDQQIKQYELELTRLKELKQEAMKQDFNRKKVEEEQRMRAQRFQQAPQQAQRNMAHLGYGPRFHGQENVIIANVQSENHQMQEYHQQRQQYQQQQVMNQQGPFQVQGIEPIRKRSNSYKTEVSEQPILNNEVRYRNGIPIGKPIRQNDNDSSFASEYPEV